MRVNNLAQGLLVAVLLTAPPVPAQEGSVQWYSVEVVIFDQRGAARDDGERWQAEPAMPAVEYPLVGIGATSAVPAFRRLDPSAHQLEGVRRKLANTAGYEVLTHLAWRQPGLARGAAPALALPSDWQPPRDSRFEPPASGGDGNGPEEPTLSIEQLRLPDDRRDQFAKANDNPFADVPPGTRLFGSLRAYRERYLHLQIDLRFSPDGWDPRKEEADGTAGMDTGSGTTEDDGDARLTDSPATYVVRQERRLRSSELHYLDHPVVGMIVTIEPVETPSDAMALPPAAIPADE